MQYEPQPAVSMDGIQLAPVGDRFRYLAQANPLELADVFGELIHDHDSCQTSAVYALGSYPVLLVAGHSVRHSREGMSKPPDLNTGSLALTVAAQASCHSLVATRLRDEDPNYSRESRFRAFIDVLIAACGIQAVIDIHGARAGLGFDVAIGTAGATANSRLAASLARGLRARSFATLIVQQGPYSGGHEYTVTKQLSREGYRPFS
jgi:hypothetical protein